MGWIMAWAVAVSAFSQGEETYRVAILDEPTLPVVGVATPVVTFDAVLGGAGATVTRLDAAGLGDAAQFSTQLFDLVVIPTGASFPLMAKDALLAFLKGGGDLLCSGGYAFDSLWLKEGAGWAAYADQLAAVRAAAGDPQRSLIANGGFEQGAEAWAGVAPPVCTIAPAEGASGAACGQIVRDTREGGAGFDHTLDVQPGHSYLVGARFKAAHIDGAGFAYLAMYQYDAQGALLHFNDFTQLRKDTDWQRYETHVNILPEAGRVVFKAGLYLAAGSAYVDDVTCAELPPEQRVNAHYGIAGDGLRIEPEQLMMFSPDQRFEGSALASASDSLVPADWRLAGPVRGFEATAQLGQVARWVPLIEARDAWDRPCGVAGAVVHHSGGPFAGSSWAIFGAENRDLFEGEAGRRLLACTVRALRSGLSIQSASTDSAIYKRGETARVKIEVHNAANVARQACVAIDLRAPAAEGAALWAQEAAVEIPPGATQTVEVPWPVAPDAPDFVQARVTLRYGDAPVDLHTSGFCVYDEGVMARGTPIRFEANAFTLGSGEGERRPAVLFGTDTYGNMLLSPSCSPWTWLCDLEAMRNGGLDMFENLQIIPPQDQLEQMRWRQLDALIQLSQRFGLPYMAGLYIGQNVAVDDATLARQAAFCREFAARYKQVPGLIYYLNGDFRLDLEDTPDMRRLWNEFLRARYAMDDALKTAWHETPPEAPLGELPIANRVTHAWYDVRTGDMTAFKCTLMKRWIHALSQAIREVDPAHPITGEYYSQPANGIDLRLTVEGMDVANFGYFDAPQRDLARLMATVKWNDMRRAGHGVNIGEFGVKTHDAWSEARGGVAYHIQRTPQEQLELFWWVAHASIAMGVSKIQNWCWSDDPDHVFPWGMAWINPLRAKPALKLYGQLKRIADRIAPTYAPADVVLVIPDTWRLGAPDQLAQGSIMNAIECLLATNVPFDVANEAQLGALAEQKPRVVVMPLAYALSDEVVAGLDKLAQSGACVYLSGDPTIDVLGNRRIERFEALLGARFDSESKDEQGLPIAQVTPVSATPVANAGQLPLFQCAKGQGQIVWAPQPWEALAGREVFVRDPAVTADPAINLYFDLFKAVGVEAPVQVAAEGAGVWRAMLTGDGAKRMVSVFPRTAVAEGSHVRVGVAGATVDFGARLSIPALVMLDAAGQAILATGSQYLRVNDVEIVRGDGAWCVASQQDEPISMAHGLWVSSTTAGRVWWKSEANDLACWMAEQRDGALRSVATVPLKRTYNGWEIETQPNALYVIAPAGAPPM